MTYLKKYFLSFIILAATSLLFLFLHTQYTQAASATATTSFPSGTYVSGEILVQYSQSVFDAHNIALHRASSSQSSGSQSSSSQISASDPVQVVKNFFVNKNYTPTVMGTIYDLQSQLIAIEKNGNTGEPLDYIAEIRRLPGVVHAQPNFLYELESPRNDYWFDSQNNAAVNAGGMWHLKSIRAHDQVSTEDAWDLVDSLTGRTYKPRVAVIDSGIDTSYDDFIGSIRQQSCKIPEFTFNIFGFGGDEKIAYTPVTKTCPEAGIGFSRNKKLLKLSAFKISYDVDHATDSTHGTKVASILASHRNNDTANVNNPNKTNTQKSGAGVAGGLVDLIPIRTYRRIIGGKEKIDTFSVVQAVAFARLNNVDIINASFAFEHGKNACTDFFGIDLLQRAQIERFGRNGGLFVTSAGNKDSKTGAGGTLIHFPSDFNHTIPGCRWASLPNTIIVVGGVEESSSSSYDVNGDGVQSPAEKDIMNIPGVIEEIRWSRDGQRDDGSWSGSNYNANVNIAAPSQAIVVPEPDTLIPKRGRGTSYAAPQVAGTLALMKYANPNLTAAQLKQMLEDSADELITLVGPDCTAGTSDDYVKNGRRVNAYNAVQAALGQSYTKKTITHADRAACLCAGSPGCEYGECGTSVNTCLSGTPDDNAVPDTTVRYRWVCKGRNGGIDSETCSVLREGGSCSSCTTDLGAVSSTVTRTNESLESSCASESRTNAYAKYYTFTLRSPAVITIDLTSSVDTYLFLHRHDSEEQCSVGEKIIENDDIVGGNTNSRVHKAVASGKYTIEATTYSPRKTGSFNLTITTGQTTKTRRCTSCATWNDWTPVITNQCGDVRQTRSCRTKSPVGCGGSIASETRTTTISAVNGEWSDWGNWSACTCTPDISDDSTVGTQTRTRTCSNPAPSCGGTTCSGSSTETQSCVTSRCAVNTVVNGGWSAWGSCGCTSSKTDSKTAGIQYRSCTNPAPSGGGARCSGSAVRSCNTSGCAVDGRWSNWSPCRCTTSKTDSATAGIQYRSCTNPAPSGGGAQCSGASSQSCNTSGCAVAPTCRWQRTSCGNKACGPQQAVCGPADCIGTCIYHGGRRIQGGNTVTFAGGCGICSGGKVCNNSGQCVTSIPRVNGGWSAWGSCGCTSSKTDSATAGIQYRSCTNPAPSGGGTQCSGASSQSCNTSGCAVTPTCSWQRTSCGSKVCGPQQAVCGPSDCTGTCPYTGGTRAQRGNTGSFTNGCGTCSGGKTCNTSGQCVTSTTPRGKRRMECLGFLWLYHQQN